MSALVSIKAHPGVVDSTRPVRPQTIGHNYKRLEQESVRNAEIERDNHRLLYRMNAFGQEVHYPTTLKERRPYTLVGKRQKEETRRVIEGNRKLVQAVAESQPILSRNEWFKHHVDHEYQRQKISQRSPTVPMATVLDEELRKAGGEGLSSRSGYSKRPSVVRPTGAGSVRSDGRGKGETPATVGRQEPKPVPSEDESRYEPGPEPQPNEEEAKKEEPAPSPLDAIAGAFQEPVPETPAVTEEDALALPKPEESAGTGVSDGGNRFLDIGDVAMGIAEGIAGEAGAEQAPEGELTPNAAVKVHIKIVEAKGIAKMDALSATDALVKVTVNGQEQKTKEQSDTMTPQWNETFTWEITDRTVPIVFEMWDVDVGKDECMGRFEASVADCPVSHARYQWTDCPPKGGQLRWGIHVGLPSEAPFSCAVENDAPGLLSMRLNV